MFPSMTEFLILLLLLPKCQGISLHLIPRLHLSEIRFGTFSGRCSPSTMTMQPRGAETVLSSLGSGANGQAPLRDASFPLSREGHGTEENVPQAVSWWKTPSVMEDHSVTMVTRCKPVRSSEAADLPASLTLTWCLLTMSFNFPSSLGSISGHRKMLGRDRQLFCEEKKYLRWGKAVLCSHCGEGNGEGARWNFTCTKDFSMVMNISTLRSMRDGFWKS